MSAWSEIATEGAKLKREQLEREIGRLKDSTERGNLTHTFSKLFMFLAEDHERLLRRIARLEAEKRQLELVADRVIARQDLCNSTPN